MKNIDQHKEMQKDFNDISRVNIEGLYNYSKKHGKDATLALIDKEIAEAKNQPPAINNNPYIAELELAHWTINTA
jgi:hypothetical protein